MSTTRPIHLLRLATSAVGIAAVGAALTGCAGIGNPGAAASAGTTSTVTSTATATTTTTSTPSASTSGYRVANCDTSLLKGSLKGDGAAAGSTYYDLSLQNTGSKPCTLQGWPGTSFVDSSGHQIGAAAVFDRSSAHETVTLLPNGHAVARLQVGQALNYSKSSCDPVEAAGIRVYPPGSTASLIVKASGLTACRQSGPKLLQVQAFHAVG